MLLNRLHGDEMANIVKLRSCCLVHCNGYSLGMKSCNGHVFGDNVGIESQICVV